jgi:hypothetical protein
MVKRLGKNPVTSGAKAPRIFVQLTARLKPCPYENYDSFCLLEILCSGGEKSRFFAPLRMTAQDIYFVPIHKTLGDPN